MLPRYHGVVSRARVLWANLWAQSALERERDWLTKLLEKVRKSGRHFWAIWGNCGPFWVIFGPLWIILGHSRAILGHLGSYLGHFGPFWVIFGHFWAILWHFWRNLRKVQIFCGIINPAILAFRMYATDNLIFCQTITYMMPNHSYLFFKLLAKMIIFDR